MDRKISLELADKLCRQEMEKQDYIVFPTTEEEKKEKYLFETEEEYKKCLWNACDVFNSLGETIDIFACISASNGWELLEKGNHKDELDWSLLSGSAIEREKSNCHYNMALEYTLVSGRVEEDNVDWKESLRLYFENTVSYLNENIDKQEMELAVIDPEKIEIIKE